MKNTQKYIVSLSLAAVLLAGGASLVVAEENRVPAGTVVLPGAPSTEKQMVLEVGPKGNVLLRGTVVSVGTATVVVKSWGGDWTVNVSSSTQLLPLSAMSQFKVGDFVGAQGMMNTGAAWTVDAKVVRDWSAKKEAQETKKEINDIIKSVSPRNWQGIASNINASANTFTLTIDGVAYTVNLAAGAKVVNDGYGVMNLADIKSGDIVRIYATISGTTATAYVVRDPAIKPHYDVKSLSK
ncbi:hypothetical protein KW786_02200 [Candidatus Parcubacteria bacterium]|nr:hypothetical protein [Candidatus Parcubacteria bacterium]